MQLERIYEITFAGEADDTLRAEFDDCRVIAGSGRTTLRVELPDLASYFGFMERTIDAGLQAIKVRSRPAHLAEHPEMRQSNR